MSETIRLTVSTADSSASYNYVDTKLREDMKAARAELDALASKAGFEGGGGEPDIPDIPDTPPEPDTPATDEEAIAAIDAAWGTDAIWSTLAQYGDIVRKSPSAFSKYIGQTLTYSHSSYGSQQVRVADVCHFDRSDGNGKAAFTFDHVAIPVKHNMNSSDINTGGYPATSMKTFLEGDFYNGMPTALRSAITPVTIPCSLTADAAPTNTPDCKVFLLSEMEVFGTSSYANEGTQLAWYAANNTDASRIKNYNGSAYYWWLRSPDGSTYFALVGNDGGLHNRIASSERGACPGFNIG